MKDDKKSLQQSKGGGTAWRYFTWTFWCIYLASRGSHNYLLIALVNCNCSLKLNIVLVICFVVYEHGTPWEMATRSLTVVCFIVVSCQNCYKHRSPKWTSLLPYPGIEIWRRKCIEMSLAEIHVPPISHIYFYLLGHHNRFDLGICWTSSIEKTQLSKSGLARFRYMLD